MNVEKIIERIENEILFRSTRTKNQSSIQHLITNHSVQIDYVYTNK